MATFGKRGSVDGMRGSVRTASHPLGRDDAVGPEPVGERTCVSSNQLGAPACEPRTGFRSQVFDCGHQVILRRESRVATYELQSGSASKCMGN